MRKCPTGFLVQGSLLRSFEEELMNKICVSRKSTSSYHLIPNLTIFFLLLVHFDIKYMLSLCYFGNPHMNI